ncbi:Uncharacterised protein [Bordetella pertussis]|nr:Uncharacterised protein [Bordetella pertussis]
MGAKLPTGVVPTCTFSSLTTGNGCCWRVSQMLAMAWPCGSSSSPQV